MRLFFGIFAPPEIISAVVKLQPVLANFCGKPVELKNLHLTLIFMPEVSDNQVAELIKIGESVTKSIAPFNMTFKNIELLPSLGEPRIVSVSVRSSPNFANLQATLAKQLTGSGVIFAPWHEPHLTLVRLKEPPSAPLPKLSVIKSDIVEFSLIESKLATSGPVYAVLHNFSLASEQLNRYRPNVSICLINSSNQVLIVKNAELLGEHWQLPQGGVDGDALEEAALRELREETGISSAEIIGVGTFRFKYKFPATHARFENDFIGQEQTPVFLRFKGDEDEIKLDHREVSDFKWVRIEDLVGLVAPVRREFTKKVYDELKILINKHD